MGSDTGLRMPPRLNHAVVDITPKKPNRTRSYEKDVHKYSDSDDSERRTVSLGRAAGRRVRSAVRDHDEESGFSRGSKESPGKAGRAESQICRPRVLMMLAGCTFLFGPLGTMLTYILIPSHTEIASSTTLKEAALPSSARDTAGHMRVLHLALAGRTDLAILTAPS